MKKMPYLLLLFFFFPFSLPAEVTLDGSIGPAGQVALKGPDYLIRAEYGEQAGANLFHSFFRFGIDPGESATFSGPLSVQNIISRVSGGEISRIDGLLRSLIPGADLYLLNPAGIIFGPDAALDLGGSFHVSTADYLRMGEEGRFYAVPMSDDLLTVSPPSAFGFLEPESGEENAAILFDGSRMDFSGKTFSVIGEDIRITNRSGLTINGGRLNIAAVAGSGEVIPEEGNLDTSSFSRMGDIEISESSGGLPSEINVRYGSIFIRGGSFVTDHSEILADIPYTVDEIPTAVFDVQAREVEIKNNSILSTDTFGGIRGADMNIRASESVRISGSRIRVGSIGAKASGAAGSLCIEAPDIRLEKGTEIQSESKGKSTGNAGNVSLKAGKSLVISDTDMDTYTTGIGNAGNVTVHGGSVILDSGTQIRAYTQGSGNAGRITLAAGSVILKDESGVKTETDGKGHAGDILMNVENLEMRDQSSLSSASRAVSGGGDAGSIDIRAEDSVSLTRGAFLTTDAESAGGGIIGLEAGNSVYLFEGEITTSVHRGSGNGGDIRIGDRESGKGPASVSLNHSRIRANADEGDGGAIFITTDNYIRSADSVVEASSRRGNDGTVRVESPDTDISSGLSTLPSDYTDASRWVQTPCEQRSAENISRFVMTERDGIPLFPEDWLASCLPVSEYFFRKQGSSGENYLLSLSEKGDFPSLIRELEAKEKNLADSLLLAAAYSASGYFGKTQELLEEIAPRAESSGDSAAKALFYNSRGDFRLLSGDKKNAIPDLKTALESARMSGDSVIIAAVLNNLGNLRAVSRDYPGALRAYEEGLALADPSPQFRHMKSLLQLNASRTELVRGKYPEAAQRAEKAGEEIRKSPDDFHKAFHLIALGMQHSGHSENIAALAEQAVRIGEKSGNLRILSYAYGILGRDYAMRKENGQALSLTRKAVFSAAGGDYPEILYRWQQQLGRLFREEGKREQAIAIYRQAVQTLHPIRMEFFRGLRDRENVFGKNVKPVYQELTALLLEKSIQSESPVSENLLLQAGEYTELLKTAEVEDFFRDECFSAVSFSPKNIRSSLRPGTVLLYPVLLPDHLALILDFPDSMKYIRVETDMTEFSANIRKFRKMLEEGKDDFQDMAARLYDLLIRPIEKELEARNTDTLVISPDGPLRMIPPAALFDGSRYLFEKYALATVLSAGLTDVKDTRHTEKRILLNGLSQEREGFSPLPHVRKELENIRKLVDGNMLMDENFTLEKLKKELQKEKYSFVHLATHAVFSESYEDSFLLTYDGRLTMDRLDRLVFSEKYEGNPLELLTLSACETAMGDDRAVFGLAGVALRSGAKSSLATLWASDDRSTFLIADEFYRQITVAGQTKAKALQQAQIRLIQQEENAHPMFWAPFLLIGNWL